MKILKFNETFNPDNEDLIFKKAIFSGGDGSGHYDLCGSLDDMVSTELENADKIEGMKFKRFSFTIGTSIKKVSPYQGCDEIIWLNKWSHLMKYEKSKNYFVGINVHKFDDYYDLLEDFPNWKLELLPYFIRESKKEFIIDFFERLLENKSMRKCWENADISEVITYIKNSEVYNAYDKLKEYLLPIFKFAKYWGDDIPEDKKKPAIDMGEMGF